VYNAIGNVAEWVSDTFAPYAENQKFTNPNYQQGMKVIKGGAYDQDMSQQRPANRYYNNPGNNDIDVGFRCAKDK